MRDPSHSHVVSNSVHCNILYSHKQQNDVIVNIRVRLTVAEVLQIYWRRASSIIILSSNLLWTLSSVQFAALPDTSLTFSSWIRNELFFLADPLELFCFPLHLESCNGRFERTVLWRSTQINQGLSISIYLFSPWGLWCNSLVNHTLWLYNLITKHVSLLKYSGVVKLITFKYKRTDNISVVALPKVDWPDCINTLLNQRHC